jgi:hypothetical protein
MCNKDMKQKELAVKILKTVGKEAMMHFIIKGLISLGLPSFVIVLVKVIVEVFG